MNPGNIYNLMSGSTDHDTDTLNPHPTFKDSKNISSFAKNDGVQGNRNG